MFESAELGHAVDKATYDAEVPALRESLLDVQFDLLEKKRFAVVVIIGGVDGAGKGETVNLLNEWMDPRHIHTYATSAPTDEERERPPMWRFWRALPPKGKIGMFFGSWYTEPIVKRAYGQIKNPALDESLKQIVRFEQMLSAEGVLLIKLWFHLSRAQQKKRLTALEASSKTRWRVTAADWEHFGLYKKFRAVSERAVRQTSTGEAPWTIVEGADARYRSLAVGRAIHEAIKARLEATPSSTGLAASLVSPVDNLHLLSALDLSLSVAKSTYDDRLEALQRKLNLLTRERAFRKRAVVGVFEGADAAGKGGAIRRITRALDVRQYSVIPIAAPTEEERAQPYLWRFFRHLPRKGKLALFDRSWYGRVLVERVEGFCSKADFMRAYREINDFEEQLHESGMVVVKFWLQISQEEQLARFEEREKTGFKRYKITSEDWRNREKWGAYEEAIRDMIDRTSTTHAPWTLVEANDKHHARLKVLGTLCDRLEKALK